MKQTAVEFLANELVKKGFTIGKYATDLFEQAKEIEKDQLKECWRQAQAEQRKEFSSSYVSKKFDIWYEQFKSENYDDRIV